MVSIYSIVAIGKFTVFKPRKTHAVTNNAGEPVAFALIEVYSAASPDILIRKTVANELGRYHLLLTNGNYIVKVSRKNSSGVYEMVFTSNSIAVKNGILTSDFRVS